MAPVLLVEDHALVAASLATALGDRGITCIPVDPTPETDLVGLAEQHGARLVLMDLELRDGLRGHDLVRDLCRAGLRVVVLSGVEDPLAIARAYEAGAEGFVSKRSSFEQLLDAVTLVASGRELQHPSERDALVRQLRAAREQDRRRLHGFDELTQRESEVLAGLCDGRSAAEIAEQGYVAVSTIRTHVRGVLTKLGVTSQAAAVARAAEADWDPAAHRRHDR